MQFGNRQRFVLDPIGRASIMLVACWLSFGVSTARAADDEMAGSAEAVVDGFHRALIAVAALDPLPELAERVRLLAPTISAAHDFSRMARLTVSSRFWREFSESDRNSYVAAFERYSIANYASRFAGVGPDTFEILESELVREGQVDVHAVIHANGDVGDVPMDYSLRFDGESFRIVNIVADGVSELTLMASQHFDIVESGGVAELIAELEAEIDKL